MNLYELERLIKDRIMFIRDRPGDDTSIRMEELVLILGKIQETTLSDGGPWTTPYNIWEWWCAKVGVKSGRLPGKEAAAAKRLIDMGVSMSDLDALWDWMEQDPWYAEKGIDLPLMAAAVLKWRAAGAVRLSQGQKWDGHR